MPRPTLSCRALLALVLGVCGMLAWTATPSSAAAAACRSGDSCVLVQVYDGGAKTDEVEVSLADIAEWTDVDNDAPYTYRDRKGGPEQDADVPAALSLAELVNRLGASDGPIPGLAAKGIASATVPRRGGTTSVVLDPFDPTGRFEDGLLPAVYRVGSDAVGFVRPLLLDDPDDVNNSDYFFQDAGQPLVVKLNKSGRTLTPTITASATDIEPGDQVQFGATVAEQTSATLTYRWTFGVGDPQAGQNPLHTYDTAGQGGIYEAMVSVTGDDGSTGQARVDITVTPAGRLGPVISVEDPEVERGVGDEFQLQLRLTNPGTPDSYTWYADDTEVIGRSATPPRHAFTTEGQHTFRLEIVVDREPERTTRLRVQVGKVTAEEDDDGDTPPTDDPTDDPTDEPTEGSTNGAGDDDAPVVGPDDGDGTQKGSSDSKGPATGPGAPLEPAGPGSPAGPTTPDGLTGILLTGAATAVDVLPPPETTTSAQQQEAEAAAARARTDPAGGAGTIQWGLGIVPLLLLAGVAREAQWLSRLRTAWASRS